jgi:hypothetical protein
VALQLARLLRLQRRWVLAARRASVGPARYRVEAAALRLALVEIARAVSVARLANAEKLVNPDPSVPVAGAEIRATEVLPIPRPVAPSRPDEGFYRSVLAKSGVTPDGRYGAGAGPRLSC